jgi:D-3-phosphoglycerate dehydrogenase
MAVRAVYIDCSPMMFSLLGELGSLPALEVIAADPPAREIARLLADTAVLINGHTTFDAELIRKLPALRSIVFLGTGASSYIDMEAAARHGICVRAIRGYGDRTVAEHAFALLMAAARDVARMDRELRAGRWDTREGIELKGATLGLIGLGGIGSEMARIGSAFGMRVIAWNRSGIPAGIPAEACEIDDLLGTCDALSLHLALDPSTRGFLDGARLARMKPGALIINTARGAIVDEDALVSALQSGHIAHAAIDVFATEPLPADHPFTRLDNVTLTSHAAWKSKAASRRMLIKALELVAADRLRLEAGQSLSG